MLPGLNGTLLNLKLGIQQGKVPHSFLQLWLVAFGLGPQPNCSVLEALNISIPTAELFRLEPRFQVGDQSGLENWLKSVLLKHTDIVAPNVELLAGTRIGITQLLAFQEIPGSVHRSLII